ncbi:MAG: flagellar export chaperone FliS [Ramlibacter sp.]
MYTLSRSPRTGARAYAHVGTEISVMSASPHQLIVMLFEGAKTAITMARHHMEMKNVGAKGKAISKAIDIVENGLRASLDAQAGGPAVADLTTDLSALYGYISQRLMQANLHNDPALLDEVDGLLDAIGSAWREIDPANKPLPAAA